MPQAINERDIVLQNFQGPLDLLLHLVSTKELEIATLSLVSITDQYLEMVYASSMTTDELADFLVIAATLLEMKSKYLYRGDDGEEYFLSEDNPKDELVQRLIEYKQIKDLSLCLQKQEGAMEGVCVRESVDFVVEDESLQLDLSLLKHALTLIMLKMERYDEDRQKFFNTIARERVTMEGQMTLIKKMLQTTSSLTFDMLFDDKVETSDVIVTFLALLELLKKKKIRIIQETLYAQILIVGGIS